VKRDRRSFVPYSNKPSVKLAREPLLLNSLAYIAVFMRCFGLSEFLCGSLKLHNFKLLKNNYPSSRVRSCTKQTAKAKEIMATGKKQRLPFMVSVG
jgi:hypothetical protein